MGRREEKEGGRKEGKEERAGKKEGREGGEKGRDEKVGSCRYQVGTVYFLVTLKSSTTSQVHRVENRVYVCICVTLEMTPILCSHLPLQFLQMHI